MKYLFQLKRRIACFASDSAGGVAAVTAILLTVLLGFIGLALDLGRLTLLESEMQRAADAGALAGARALAPYPNDAGVVGDILWDNVYPDDGTKPTKMTISKNLVDGKNLTDCTVEVGYWDLQDKVLRPYTTTWLTNLIPAVRVTISKAGESNGGPAKFFFSSFVGKADSDLTVQSLAALPGGPSLATKGAAFPFAVPKEFVEKNWNKSNLSVYIGSIYNNNTWQTSDQGQWTSFLVDRNDVPTIRELMRIGNPEGIKIGDKIYIQPGAKATLYGNAAAYIGQVVLIPVVDGNITARNHLPIVGFVAFYIEGTNQGQKWVKGHFEKNYLAPGTRTDQTAPFFGTWASSPKLIQ
ncbi:MAG: pilus assembly protein TadG-related protein [Desulfobacca sp.]|uniref:pilus assembly protein TadG-related protein n=1 Tax=Desulfobacca sp. TaxID=2067990 RepID=UPI00404A9045